MNTHVNINIRFTDPPFSGFEVRGIDNSVAMFVFQGRGLGFGGFEG